nr:helix-turn-helix domain-containing protein [Methylobacterium sp. OTU13CASTA1]
MKEQFGQTIREAREKRGWSQEFVAAKVGATQSTIDRIENGITQRSRVLPEIAGLLELEIPGVSRPTQQVTQAVGDLVKVSYVLPQELVDRINKYKLAIGVSSDDEAVRRLIDDQLKKRDEIEDIVDRLLKKNKALRSIRESAGFVLANHPLVKSIEFRGSGVIFTTESGLTVEALGWGPVFIKKQDGNPYLYHRDFAPDWLTESNLTDDVTASDALPF